MSEELGKIIKELVGFGERHGQIHDAIGFTSLCSTLKIIDIKHNTSFYDIVCNEFMKNSRSAPAIFDTYVIKVIKSISQGIVHQTQIVEEKGRMIPVVNAKKGNRK
ncbi:MAG: hypothetical protein J7K21_05450 [Desulfurococcales archaeon]|nr:hypothetical protein [Desulfurococcales archaeon]